MNKNALLIVDLQNDFCPEGALPVKDGDKIVSLVNDLISIAVGRDIPIFASRDWHPAKTTHFNTYGGKWPPHCIQMTGGAEFHPNLQLPNNAIIISKGTKENEDAYSAFDGTDKNGLSFLSVLVKKSVKKIFICGLALDYCVKASALDARKLEFEVVVFENATKGVDINPSGSWYTKVEMWNAGVKIMNFPEFN